MSIQKNFRFTNELFTRFNKLKEEEKVETDIEFVKKMLDCIELMREIKEKEQKTVPVEEHKELQRQYQTLLVELGRLQGELNVYKQQALPKKPGKRWWQVWK